MKFSLRLRLPLMFAAAGAFLSLAASGDKVDAVSAPTGGSIPEIPATVEAWTAAYPLQAESFAASSGMEASPTGYGGSLPYQHLDERPELKVLYKGIAFSSDYREDRGHVYAWKDLFETKRVNAKSPAACMTCKTSAIADVFAAEGWGYAKKPLSAYSESAHAGIDCFSCHDPATHGLRVVQPAFREAIAERGVDLSKASAAEMRTYVCAQCHSEYYFEPGTTRVVHPWGEGLSPGAMYRQYGKKPSGFDGDFTQSDSGVRLLKAQHPDYEEFSGGIHGSAGVSCADCHMPTVEKDGTSFSTHRITSPLLTADASCLPCHGSRTADFMIGRVKYIQDAVYAAGRRASAALAAAHAAVAVSSKNAEAAKELIREAQWHWDYTMSANSMGFHNQTQALDSLTRAIDLAHKAAASVR